MTGRSIGIAAILMLLFAATPVFSDGVFRNGVGGRAMALGGADAGYAPDPLGAMAANPAGLGFLTKPEFDVSLNAAAAYGEFTKSGISSGHLGDIFGAYPDAAFAMPLGQSPVTAGISFVTDSALRSDWHYNDPPSASHISYGFQRDESEFIVFRSAAGLGFNLGPQWSFGANIGLLYNENQLLAPYIFQTTPGLVGAKTLLNLQTSGYGWNAEVGALFRLNEQLQFGLTYKSPATIFSHGYATGDAGAQLSVPSFPFEYSAQVKNKLPQIITGGASWKFCDAWRLALQVDWIDWAHAFTTLPVSLSHGNSALPAALNDYIPLNWRDEFVYRAGLEYNLNPRLTLRGGYCYGQSPVPDSTLTPITAAIMQNTITAGLGYHWKRYTVDFAYQCDLPTTRHIGASSLQAGEYSNSSIQVGLNNFVLSSGIKF